MANKKKNTQDRFTNSLNIMAAMMPKNEMILPTNMTEHIEKKQTIAKLDEPVYFAFCLAVQQVAIRATFGQPDAPFVGSFFASGIVKSVNTNAVEKVVDGKTRYVQAEVPMELRDSFKTVFMDRFLSEIADEKSEYRGQWLALGDKALEAGRTDKNGNADPAMQALQELVAHGILHHRRTYSFRSTWPKRNDETGTPVQANRTIRRF